MNFFHHFGLELEQTQKIHGEEEPGEEVKEELGTLGNCRGGPIAEMRREKKRSSKTCALLGPRLSTPLGQGI